MSSTLPASAAPASGPRQGGRRLGAGRFWSQPGGGLLAAALLLLLANLWMLAWLYALPTPAP